MERRMVGLVHTRKDDREFITAQSGYGVVTAHGLLKPAPYLDKQLVPRGVPHRVVHDLEVVDVDKQQGDGMPFSSRMAQRLSKAIEEDDAIG